MKRINYILSFALSSIILSCVTVKNERKLRYIYHPYDFELCNEGEKCILVKGTYVIEHSIQLIDKINIVYDGSGSIIKMTGSAPVKNGFSLINVRNGKDLEFSRITLDGNREERGCSEQYAHAFTIVGSRNLFVNQMAIKNSVVDGLYLGAGLEADSSSYCRNIRIENTTIDASCRNGISIINAYGVLINSVVVNHSNGLSPAAGIDVESDALQPIPSNKNIIIENSVFSNHKGCGIMTSQKGSPKDIMIRNNTVEKCEIGIFAASVNTQIIQNTVLFSRLFGIQSVRYDNNPKDANIIADNIIRSAETAIHYSGEGGEIVNNKISNIEKTAIWLNGNTVNDTRVLLRKNEIDSIGEYGIYSNNFAYTKLLNNGIKNCKKEGINIMNGSAEVDSNIIFNCHTAAVITGSKCRFMHNVIEECVTGLSAIGGSRIKLEGRIEKNKFISVHTTWFGDVNKFEVRDNIIE